MKSLACYITICSVLVGCGANTSEIQQWMRDKERTLPRQIEPLPQVKPFTPFTYTGTDLPDPFKPRALGVRGPKLVSPALDPNRRREPLESFSIEQLKMVGTIQRGKEVVALVRAEKSIFQVRKGNYMGQNYGLITDINESEIKLKEIVPDSQGELVERETAIQLVEDIKETKK
jgi:type IV pilus assembly protein PilP